MVITSDWPGALQRGSLKAAELLLHVSGESKRDVLTARSCDDLDADGHSIR